MTTESTFRSQLARLGRRQRFHFPARAIPRDFRKAAVLLPFWTQAGEVQVALTRRSESLSQHKGQVSFPGGRLNEGESWAEAALRESFEEVGIEAADVEVLGELDEAWSGARHHIVPVVGWLASPPNFRANPDEVAEILVAAVSELLRPESRGQREVVHNGVRYINPTLRWSAGSVVGLSADLLLEALAWGTGQQPSRGPARLEELRTYFGR